MDEPLESESVPAGRGEDLRYVALAAAAGGLAGFVGAIFHFLINTLIAWPQWLERVLAGPGLVAAAALVTLLCTVLSVFLVRRFAPEAEGSGVPEIEGAMDGLRTLRWRRILPVKFFAGVIAISSGLVLGREGPTIHIGASVAAGFSEFFRTTELERRGLLAAGAAAGLACAFNAPLAAVLFVIEETHKQFPYTFRTYMGVIAASILATVVMQVMGGTAPDLTLVVQQVPLGLLPAFMLLGGILGIIGVLLNAGIMWSVEVASRLHKSAPYAHPAVVGALTGVLFIVLPQTVTGGEGVIMQLAAHTPAIQMLLVLALLRYLTMVTSYSTAVPGGIFAPILTLAVCIGLAFGTAAQLAIPDAGVIPLAFGIAAMGGLFTASVRAPIVGVVLTLELTSSYALALPLMVTCLTASLVAQWLGGQPIYRQMLDRTLAQAGIATAPPDKSAPTGLA